MEGDLYALMISYSKMFKSELPEIIIHKFITCDHSYNRLKINPLTIAVNKKQILLFEEYLMCGYYKRYEAHEDWYILTDKGKDLLAFINL